MTAARLKDAPTTWLDAVAVALASDNEALAAGNSCDRASHSRTKQRSEKSDSRLVGGADAERQASKSANACLGGCGPAA